MRRAEVWWADLPPPVGPRPVVVLTRDAVCDTIGAVVVALVTRTSRGLPTEVSIGRAEGLPRPSVVNTDNIFYGATTATCPAHGAVLLSKNR
jgi:mRNA interferase MazF